MKNRICALLLTLCLTLTSILLASCTETAPETLPETTPETTPGISSETTAEELLRTASEKFSALESYAAVQTTATSATMAGTTFDVLKTMQLKVDRTTPIPTSFVQLESGAMGDRVKNDFYYDTEWVYNHVHETNVNSALQYKHKRDTSRSNHDFGFTDVLQVLPAELLADVKPMKNEDDSHTVALTVPADTFVQVYSELVESFLDESMTNARTSDAKVEITVTKEGYYKEYKIDFTTTATVEGESASLSATIEIVFDNPSVPVEVSLPEGYENFPTAHVTYN